MTDQAPRSTPGRVRRMRRKRSTRVLVSRLETRIRRIVRRQQRLRAVVDRQAAQIERLQAIVAKMRERSLPLEQDAKTRMIQHSRMSVQLGMLEQRIGRLEEQLATGAHTNDDAAHPDAGNVLDLVQTEHERVRVRLQLVSHYEERLRRVEAAIESIAEGDVRRMV